MLQLFPQKEKSLLNIVKMLKKNEKKKGKGEVIKAYCDILHIQVEGSFQTNV